MKVVWMIFNGQFKQCQTFPYAEKAQAEERLAQLNNACLRVKEYAEKEKTAGAKALWNKYKNQYPFFMRQTRISDDGIRAPNSTAWLDSFIRTKIEREKKLEQFGPWTEDQWNNLREVDSLPPGYETKFAMA